MGPSLKGNQMESKETDLWLAADPRQKSHLVNVLHWFNFRPDRLRGSWKHEEVLTWELLRALEILPERLFCRPILEHLGSLDPAAQPAVQYVLQSPVIQISPYPSLELRGGKRNCRSDIGLGVAGERPNIWIEAKTAPFTEAKLREQLDQQSEAMASLLKGTPGLLATLLPGPRALADYPNLSWNVVVDTLKSCISALAKLPHAQDVLHGYVRIAQELIGRIQSHPNCAHGWL